VPPASACPCEAEFSGDRERKLRAGAALGPVLGVDAKLCDTSELTLSIARPVQERWRGLQEQRGPTRWIADRQTRGWSPDSGRVRVGSRGPQSPQKRLSRCQNDPAAPQAP